MVIKGTMCVSHQQNGCSYGRLRTPSVTYECFIKGDYQRGEMLEVLLIELSKESGTWRVVLWTDVLEVQNAIIDEVGAIESRFAFGRTKSNEYDFDSFLFDGTKGYLNYMEKVCALADVFPAISGCTAPLKLEDAVIAVLKEQ